MQTDKDIKPLLLKKSVSSLSLILISNIFAFLIAMIDGIVVSHYLGPNALNSVNLIIPYSLLLGALYAVIAQGTSIVLSRSMAESDSGLQKDIIKTLCFLTLILMVFVALTSVPAATIFINSHDLSAVQSALIWDYTKGVLIGLFIGAATTPATYVFIATGKADKIILLSMVEGITHLVFDLLFIRLLKTGIAGAGYASAISNAVRLVLSIIMLQKELNIFPLTGMFSGRIALDIMKAGLFPGIFALSFSARGYIVNRLVLSHTGQTGMTAHSVSMFILMLCGIITTAIIQTSQPALGISVQVDAKKTVSRILRWNLYAGLILTGSIVLLTIIWPSSVYYLYKLIPQGVYQENVVRIMAVYSCLHCVSTILLNYMNNRGMKYISSAIAIAESVVLIPLFAVLLQLVSSYGVFLAFPISSLIVLALCIILILSLHKDHQKNAKRIGFWECHLYPQEGAAFSAQLSKDLEQFNLSKKAIYRISLCAEEAVSHVRKLSKKSEEEPSVDLYINLYNDRATMFIINDGESEKIIDDIMAEDTTLTMANNYFIMRKVSKLYNYRQLNDLNTYSITIDY